MAFSLTSERSIAVAQSSNIVFILQRWLASRVANSARRTALTTLLSYEEFRLNDLGLSRHDVIEALRTPHVSAGQLLAAKRSANAAA